MLKKVLIAVVALGISGSMAVLYAKAPPKKVTLDQCKKKKPGVAFDHQAHAMKRKIKCKTCHHNGKHQSCATAKCHLGKAEGKRPGCAEMSLKKNPYHITCIGCHKKEKKKGAPTTCKGCHK